MQHYETPLYDLNIDTKVISDLEATGKFQFMNQKTDEDEHSLEMTLPYIAKVSAEKKADKNSFSQITQKSSFR